MELINIGFHLMSSVLALLVSALLVWVNKERKHSNRLLAFVLILFALQNILLVLFFSRLILKVPLLIRVFTPTTFLISPLAFLYGRSILHDEFKFRKYDGLFLIPAVFMFFNFIPYYILPVSEKVNYLLANFYGDKPGNDMGRGVLPSKIYYLIRIGWSGVFLFLSFRLLYNFKKENTASVYSRNKPLLNWLLIFYSLLTSVFAALILKLLIPPLSNTGTGIGDLLLGVTILYISLQLFIRPQVLYGVFQPVSKTSVISESPTVVSQPIAEPLTTIAEAIDLNITVASEIKVESLDFQTQLRYKILIEQFFQERKPYLQVDYSLEQLVADIHLPRYVISAFINRQYGMGFREYLNTFRVDYFKSNLSNPVWKNLTLEAIAQECGFISRSTFISNFKKITGITPSEFVRQQKGNI